MPRQSEQQLPADYLPGAQRGSQELGNLTRAYSDPPPQQRLSWFQRFLGRQGPDRSSVGEDRSGKGENRSGITVELHVDVHRTPSPDQRSQPDQRASSPSPDQPSQPDQRASSPPFPRFATADDPPVTAVSTWEHRNEEHPTVSRGRAHAPKVIHPSTPRRSMEGTVSTATPRPSPPPDTPRPVELPPPARHSTSADIDMARQRARLSHPGGPSRGPRTGHDLNQSTARQRTTSAPAPYEPSAPHRTQYGVWRPSPAYPPVDPTRSGPWYPAAAAQTSHSAVAPQPSYSAPAYNPMASYLAGHTRPGGPRHVDVIPLEQRGHIAQAARQVTPGMPSARQTPASGWEHAGPRPSPPGHAPTR